MKKNHFLFQLCLVVLCCFMCSTTLYAKDGKIKYCNYIIYEGGIESKQPKGIGKIVIYGKKSAVPAVLIEGTFDGNTIINPRVEISVDFEDQFFNDEFKIDGKILINLNKESKYESFDLIFDDAIIYPSDPGFLIQVSKYESEYVSSIKVQNLVLSFLLGEKDFEQVNHVSDAVAVDAAVTAAVGKVNEHTRYWRLKAITQDFKYHFPFPNNERHSANVFHGEIVGSLKGPEQMKKLGYNPTHCYGRFVFANRISSIGNPFYVLAGNLVSDGSVFINEETNFKVTDNDWEGNRVFSDGTNIKKSLGKLECEVIFSDGGKFSGTLKSVEPYGNLYPVAASSTIDKNVFYSGEYTKDGRTEKWIKGEPLSVLHKRIVNLYDEDLVAKIESGSVKEDEAASIQRIRENEKAAAEREAREKAEYAAILQSRWKCSDILFGGRFKGTIDGDKAFRALWGIDHTYFDGEVFLTLNADGEAVFAALSGPSQKAIDAGRGRALQVNSLCQNEFTKRIENGKWSIEGEKIIVTGMAEDWTLTINKGGQTIECSMRGMLASTLKIMQKK